jgi:hypothetical protein
MKVNIIDKRCTFKVCETTRGFAFQYQGKTHRCTSQESLHLFFLKNTSFDTIKLRFPKEKYYIHFTLDEPEEFASKIALRRVLSQESQGAWVEEKNGKQRFFVDKGWVFSKIEELSEEEFFSRQPSNLTQKLVSFVATVALGALTLGSQLTHKSNHAQSVGFATGFLFQAGQVLPVLSQMTAGGEFKINTNVTRDQLYTKIASLEGGGFVIVWSGDQTGNSDIYGRIYNSTNTPIGTEFRLNFNTSGSQYLRAVAGLIGGGFVTVWSGDQTGNNDVYALVSNATGAPKGTEFRCNYDAIGNQFLPAVAGLIGGSFITVWCSDNNGSRDIYAKIFNGTESAIGDEFRCNTNVTGDQSYPAVAGLLNGSFITVWHGAQTGNYDIYAQIFNEAGNPIGEEFRCNTNVVGNQDNPSVASIDDGGFVIVWQGNQYGNSDIFARIFNSRSEPIGDEFRCNNNETNIQRLPAVAGLKDIGFVIVWEGYQTLSYEIYLQVFNATGGPIGSELRCNSNTTGDQVYAQVSGLQDGSFITVWGGRQTGEWDVYGQRYDDIKAPRTTAWLTSTSLPSLTITSASTASSPEFSGSTETSLPLTLLSSGSSTFASSSRTDLTSLSSLSSPDSTFPSTTILVSSVLPSHSASNVLSITTLIYETTYSITSNGFSVGSFIFQGGTGLIDGTQSNTIMLNIDAGFVGETFTLFNIPPGREGEFQTIELVGVACQSFESQIVQEGESQAYQVIFQGTTCALATRSVAEFFPTDMLRV